LSLILAAPVAPWIAVVPDPYSYLYVTAFSLFQCQIASSQNSFSGCYIQPLKSLSQGQFGYSDISGFVNSGQALGGLAITFTVGLLFPAALMSSVATYRLSLLEKYGVPPYTAGCSLASLSVAQSLGWAGFGLAAIVWFCALGLCNNVITAYPSISGATPNFSNLPGEVLFGLGVTFTAVGASLVSVVARRETLIRGVGCNGGGCCNISVEEGHGGAFRESTALLAAGK